MSKTSLCPNRPASLPNSGRPAKPRFSELNCSEPAVGDLTLLATSHRSPIRQSNHLNGRSAIETCRVGDAFNSAYTSFGLVNFTVRKVQDIPAFIGAVIGNSYLR